MALDVTVSEAEEKEFTEFLSAQLREFNNRHSPHHLAARQPGALRPVHVMLRDETGKAVGGLSGSTYWDWLEVEKLFLPAPWRGKGLGASLLRRAEAIAIDRGARQAFLTTYEFQARVFYEKHGYYVVGKLEGCPPGSAFYWMRKDLWQSQGQNG